MQGKNTTSSFLFCDINRKLRCETTETQMTDSDYRFICVGKYTYDIICQNQYSIV